MRLSNEKIGGLLVRRLFNERKTATFRKVLDLFPNRVIGWASDHNRYIWMRH
jgi:hypothetical protein